jgi:hypothetical protein
MFEKVESANADALVQMSHLSFQELMATEYASAVVRYSHRKNSTGTYLNYISSSSGKALDRERLSQSWWEQVWLQVGEMVLGAEVMAWYNALAEDERAHLRVGSFAYHYDGNRMSPVFYKLLRREEYQDGFNCPWKCGFKFRVTDVDWSTHRVSMKAVKEPSKQLFLKTTCQFQGAGDTCQMSDCQWPMNGVAAVLRNAVRTANLDVIKQLVANKVHYGCVDDHATEGTNLLTAFNLSMKDGLLESFKCLLSLKADLGASPCSHALKNSGHRSKPAGTQAFFEALTFFSSQMELRAAMPVGVFQEALEGHFALDCDSSKLDPNALDPDSSMTLLMFAAAGGSAGVVKGLLKRRALVDTVTREGCTALTFAAECSPKTGGGLECMQLLIEARADVNHRSGKSYTRPMFEMYGNGNPMGNAVCLLGHEEKLNLLLRSGYDVNLGNDYNMTPIFCAAKRCNVPMIQNLIDAKSEFLEAKLDTDRRPSHGFYKTFFPTANQIYAINGLNPQQFTYDYLEYLLDLKIDPHSNWQIMGQMNGLWHNAVCDERVQCGGDFSCLQLMIDKKFNVNAPISAIGLYNRVLPGGYMSAMDMAESIENPALTRFLLEQKGDVRHGFLRLQYLTGSKVNLTSYMDWLELQELEEEQVLMEREAAAAATMAAPQGFEF